MLFLKFLFLINLQKPLRYELSCITKKNHRTCRAENERLINPADRLKRCSSDVFSVLVYM